MNSGRALVFIVPLLAACPSPPPPEVYEEAAVARPLDVIGDASDASCAVPTDASSGPTPDFTAVLPYGGPEQDLTFTVVATSELVDVQILTNSTASFASEIAALQQTLGSQIIPALRNHIPSLTVGLSSFENMPFAPFGSSTDRPFVLYSPQTSDLATVNYAASQIYVGQSIDSGEDWAEGLYQVGVGSGFWVNGLELIQPFVAGMLPNEGTVGGVGFRTDATRVVVLIADAPTDDSSDYGNVVPNAHPICAALGVLASLNVYVVGLSASDESRTEEEEVALATGATANPTLGGCATGLGGTSNPDIMGICPLVFDIAADGTGLSTSLVAAVTQLIDALVYGQVFGTAIGDTNNFVQKIEAVSAAPMTGGIVNQFPEGAPDGINDTFTQVNASTQMTFQLHLRNTSVPPTDVAQVFLVHIQVLGDGAQLKDLLLQITVPAGTAGLDAGIVD